jgi:hypothetical protein
VGAASSTRRESRHGGQGLGGERGGSGLPILPRHLHY